MGRVRAGSRRNSRQPSGHLHRQQCPGIGSHALSHNFTAPVWQDYLIALPAIGLGLWLGFRLDRYLDPAVFRKLVLLLLLLLGASMIF
jgi:uncharacterized membrane protein YfcA